MFNEYKAELYNLMVIQEQSNDFIEKITKAGEIFEYIRIHKMYLNMDSLFYIL